MNNDHIRDDLDKALAVVQKWLPHISKEERDLFTNGLVTMNTNTSTGWIFLDRVIMTGKTELLDPEVMLAGSGAFYGAMMMCILQGEILTKDRIDNLFDFMAMYMIADNYLDDISIPEEERKRFINKARKILSGEEIVNDEQSLDFLYDRYRKIIERTPDAIVYLYEAFHAEMISCHVQTRKNISKDILQHIAEWKGGSTVCAIQCILGLKVTNVEYELGTCIQMTDDIMDLGDDIDLNISTAATLTLEQEYCVDSYVCQTIFKIDKLEKYALFKPILLQAVMIGVGSQEFFSNRMKELFEPYVYIQPNNSKTYRDTFQKMFCKTIASRIRILQN